MSTWNDVTIRLLGPVALVRGGVPIPIPGQRQRRFLASLVLRAGQVISKEAISDDSWDGEPPLTVSGQLQTSAWMIRRVLEQAGLPRDTLGSHDRGYELRVPPGAIDLTVFRETVREARDLYGRAQHRDASDRLDTALELWQGPALADVTSSRLRLKAEALEEERTGAVELRALIDIGLGRHNEAIARLSELVDRDPFREDLYVSLMKAYYAEGRQVDAIQVFHRAKRLLREQIGINPGARMTKAMQAILSQDDRFMRVG
ncbi:MULTISPECIES: AfsR/SARP family transcriptional regulator [Streptomyces]|uniref:AfsR/SARP family transcriptional regulator n=1 Tax=Streptomyces broussonetiae TaxID=2686304 RepID=A0ABV5E9D5_9ACTN|nr:AfsR/SARP family transcriptional regulator [Streptomyces sp. B93]MBC7270411.1 AfsR/SARP family transcriptional regulator [Streptomyces sp.]MBQ1092072.1 AfsR/SARP family transcriptional regulator [Streptomyces sp. B93]